MEVEILTQNDNVVWWMCPVCDWAISGLAKEYIKVDIDCPGCDCRKLSEFEPVAS